MKTLQDVAKAFKQAAGKSIYPGVDSSLAKFRGNRTIKTYKQSTAFSTGNLLRNFVTQNNPATIGRKTIEGFELVLNIAPNGAEYGQYVHYGTSKMGARPFAEIGADDKGFNDILDEFLDEQVDEMIASEVDQMDSQFKKAGFTIS